MAIEIRSDLVVTQDTAEKKIIMEMNPDDALALAEILEHAPINLFSAQWLEAIDMISEALKKKAEATK